MKTERHYFKTDMDSAIRIVDRIGQPLELRKPDVLLLKTNKPTPLAFDPWLPISGFLTYISSDCFPL